MIPRMRRQRAWRAGMMLSVAALLCGLTVTLGAVFGSFTSASANPSNNFASAPDYVAPTTSRSVIGKTQGGTPGYVHQGGTYQVYGEVTDTGNPASGVSTVSSNTSTVTTGAVSASLTSGAFAVGGLSYGYRSSASLTANASLAEGTYSYTLAMADVAGNSRTQAGFSVIVDNTPPSAADVQTANASGGTVGRAEAGDTISYTFSEPPDPNSILAGWDGSSTVVTVQGVNGTLVLGDDTLRVFDSTNTTQLPLGTVDLGASTYVGGTLGLGQGTNFTSSTMSISGNVLTVTLGTPGTGVTTALLAGTMQWTPSTAATDRAGNAMSGTSVNESGGSDKEF